MTPTMKTTTPSSLRQASQISCGTQPGSRHSTTQHTVTTATDVTDMTGGRSSGAQQWGRAAGRAVGRAVGHCLSHSRPCCGGGGGGGSVVSLGDGGGHTLQRHKGPATLPSGCGCVVHAAAHNPAVEWMQPAATWLCLCLLKLFRLLSRLCTLLCKQPASNCPGYHLLSCLLARWGYNAEGYDKYGE